ncbi:MAG: PAS domain S-box protein [Myxococcales bacterium]|nr:PAS domain S-box protein [Myxococcales bacterium]
MTTKIMIVEDDHIVSRALQAQLEEQGYKVIASVGSEHEAVAAALRCNPDLVLMDIDLGAGGNGIEAAARLRSCADIPVVFMSAYADSDTLERAVEQLPFGFLVKPLRDRSLRPAIEVAIRRHRSTTARHDRRRDSHSGGNERPPKAPKRDGDSSVADVGDVAITSKDLPSMAALAEATFGQISVGVCCCLLDGRFLRVNSSFCDICGYEAEELIGRRFADITHSHDLERDWELARQLAEGKISRYTIDKRYVRKGGQIVWVQLDVSLLTDDAGKAVGYLRTVVDITERIRATEEMKLREERLRRAELLGRTGYYEFSADRSDPVWSEGLRAIWGIPANENPTFDQLVGALHPEDRDSAMQAFERAVRERRGFDLEFRVTRPYSGTVTVRSVGEITMGEPGTPPRYFGTLVDITSEKRVEAELAKSVERRDRLLREIHHRVKNNLSVISGLVYLYGCQLKDSALRDSLEQLRNRIRAIALVHEKLYRGENVAAVDLADYVRDIADEQYSANVAQPQPIDISVDVGPVRVSLDTAVPLGLIVSELLTNAVKHAFPDGSSGSIRVCSVRRGESLVLEIRDDGVGIADESEHGGGFGLQLVRDLADQIGASVAIDRQSGTRVAVELPLPQEQVLAQN